MQRLQSALTWGRSCPRLPQQRTRARHPRRSNCLSSRQSLVNDVLRRVRFSRVARLERGGDRQPRGVGDLRTANLGQPRCRLDRGYRPRVGREAVEHVLQAPCLGCASGHRRVGVRNRDPAVMTHPDVRIAGNLTVTIDAPRTVLTAVSTVGRAQVSMFWCRKAVTAPAAPSPARIAAARDGSMP